MTQLVYLVERIAPGLYLICAAGLLFWLRRLFISRRRLAMAEFELEREMAEEQRAAAITWTFTMIEITLAIVAIAHVIAPTVRNDLLTASANLPTGGTGSVAAIPTRFETSTPGGDGSANNDLMLTVTAQGQAGDPGGLILLTAVPSATPVGKIIPGYPTPTDCNDPQVSLIVPDNGQEVYDTLVVRGVANLANFSKYKLEMRGPSTSNEFAPLQDGNSPVTAEGILGQIPLSIFAPGDYQFRLAVFDSTGTLRASCTRWVVVVPPPATNTPLPPS